MAPGIRIPAEDTLKTLHNVLRKHIDANRVLKEAEKKMLSGEDYQLMRVDLNNTPFLQPLDADNTKASIYYIRQKFIRFCDHAHTGQWGTAILKQNCDKGMMMAFLYWICETFLARRRKKGKRKSVNQYWRDFKMLYRRVNGCFVDANDSGEVVKYINGILKVKFGLDNTSKHKPVAGPDDLLLLLVHHWARDESVFPTEDDRLDVATIMLFQAYTGGRPAEFVHSSKGKASEDPLGEAEDANKRKPPRKASDENYHDESDGGDIPVYDDVDLFDNDDDDDDADDSDAADENTNESSNHNSGYSSDGTDLIMIEDADNCHTAELDESGQAVLQNCNDAELDESEETARKYKALCYEDICLWIVQNPKRGERDLLAMEVHLRHHKGVDRKPKPTTFLFRENPRPILCPISHILARAIRDDAILVDGYTSAEPFFETDLWGQSMKAMKVHWKPEWLKQPVFRRSVRTATGWIKSKTKPMTYSSYAFYIDRLGRDTGFEDKLTTYCFRRGTANAIDGAAPDAVRDQVMRQDPFTGVFNGAYLNNCVRFNVQDAFLESDISDDGLTRAFTHMSIRCNPGAPKEVPREVMVPLLAADPDIASLERRFKESYTQIKWEYKLIKRAPKKIKKEYHDLQKQLTNAKKSLKSEIEDAYRKDYFFRIHNEMMKMQLKRQSNKTIAAVEEEEAEPVIDHQLAERSQLQQILCDFSPDLSSKGIVSRKVCAINLFVALASRQELQTRKPRSNPVHHQFVKQESPAPDPDSDPFSQLDAFPLVCEKTQCIICIGNERLSCDERKRTFLRASHMMDHVENVHLKYEPANQKMICHHPVCKAEGLVLNNVMHFKNHVAKAHKIELRQK